MYCCKSTWSVHYTLRQNTALFPTNRRWGNPLNSENPSKQSLYSPQFSQVSPSSMTIGPCVSISVFLTALRLKVCDLDDTTVVGAPAVDLGTGRTVRPTKKISMMNLCTCWYMHIDKSTFYIHTHMYNFVFFCVYTCIGKSTIIIYIYICVNYIIEKCLHWMAMISDMQPPWCLDRTWRITGYMPFR